MCVLTVFVRILESELKKKSAQFLNSFFPLSIFQFLGCKQEKNLAKISEKDIFEKVNLFFPNWDFISIYHYIGHLGRFANVHEFHKLVN